MEPGRPLRFRYCRSIHAGLSGAAMRNRKLLLCRPVSGLCDILCQIGVTSQYAKATGRLNIVDTNFRNSWHFRDDFSRYFISLDENLVLDIGAHAELVDRLAAYPAPLTGRISSYVPEYDYDARCYRDADTGTPLKLDFDRDYDAPLILHHATSRRGDPIAALERMRLQPMLRELILRRCARIGEPYCGLHIRATDYAMDYRQRLEKMKGRIEGPIFLATDNAEVVDHVREAFPDRPVHSFTRFQKEPGTPLHCRPADQDAWDVNCDAIADLFMLAMGKSLTFFPLEPNIFGASHSGFSLLARDLLRKPMLVRHLLALPYREALPA